MRTVLTIAGSDSSGGAGIQADLKTFAALGVHGASAVTAITAQNTTDILAIEVISADIVTAQIEAVAADLQVHAVKTGMLANAAIVEAVAATIAELDLPNLVVDPVIFSTSGSRLLDVDGVEAMKSELLPRARVVTPNVPEAEILTGISIRSLEEARAAAQRLLRFGPSAVIITGGHAPGAAAGLDPASPEVVDLLLDGDVFTELSVPRIASRNLHGTGCTHAAAVAAFLATGDTVVAAGRKSQRYVSGAICPGITLGRGGGSLDHFWQHRKQLKQQL